MSFVNSLAGFQLSVKQHSSKLERHKQIVPGGGKGKRVLKALAELFVRPFWNWAVSGLEEQVLASHPKQSPILSTVVQPGWP